MSTTSLATVWGDLRDTADLTYNQRQAFDTATPVDRYSIEAAYAGLPDAALRAVESLVLSDRTEAEHVEKVRWHDDDAVEVVWYDDWGDDGGPTEVRDWVLDQLEEDLQSFFGELWRVDRKPDNRRRDSENVQRALVRRVSHLDFHYDDEEEVDAELMREGTPDGVPEDASDWGDLAHWVEEPHAVDRQTNLYVYETGTGTQHLVQPRARAVGFYYDYVTESASTFCGQPLDPQTLADADAFEHYPPLAHAHYDAETSKQTVYGPDVRLDPEGVLGEDLCGSCWRSFADIEEDGDEEKLVPPSEYDWVQMRIWGQDRPVEDAIN